MRWLGLALIPLLLSACATSTVRTVGAGGMVELEARERTLARREEWGFSGRVSLSQGSDTGSGRIEWVQRGDDYRVTLSSALAGQSWQLERTANLVRLSGSRGEVRQGVDPERFLFELTGWRLPLQSLPRWLRGRRAEPVAGARVVFDDEGRLQRLVQAGWQIDYREWDGSSPDLPVRVFASSDDARVRLVIERWQ